MQDDLGQKVKRMTMMVEALRKGPFASRKKWRRLVKMSRSVLDLTQIDDDVVLVAAALLFAETSMDSLDPEARAVIKMTLENIERVYRQATGAPESRGLPQ